MSGTSLELPGTNGCCAEGNVVIGLVGGIAAGKSTVLQALRERGVGVLDCDKVGHTCYAPGEPCALKIAEVFGPVVLTSAKGIDRSELGKLVFGNPAKLKLLTDIVWPELYTRVQAEISVFRSKPNLRPEERIFCLEAAVLLEANMADLVDCIWIVQIPEEEACRRVMARNGLSEDAAMARVRSQGSNDHRLSLAQSTGKPVVVFDNRGSAEGLHREVEQQLNNLLAQLSTFVGRQDADEFDADC
eukprot:RCo004942